MRYALMHPADQLVAIMHRIYTAGLTTMSGGNLSVCEANGDIWVTPGGIDKGSLTRHDMVCIHKDGTQSGFRKPTSELLVHLAIYQARENVKAVLHAHSPALITFSILNSIPDVRLIPNARIVCGKIGKAPYARMGSPELADSIANEFKKGYSVVLLENHGICIGAETINQAYLIFETLEFAARSELYARRLGPVNPLSDAQIDLARTKAHTRLSDFYPKQHSSEELAARRDMIAFIQRAIQQKLFTSGNGTLSVRLSDGSFLITPYGRDRRQLHEEHLVLVNRGMKETGKTPSRAVFLHELIYRRQPDVKAIIGAHPPHLMAFTLTDQVLNMNLMPESYVMLHHLPRHPYGINYLEPQKTADLFTADTPAILLENDGIIVTGQSLIQAYDRFEVAEFTARAQLAIPADMAACPLNADRIGELNRYFP
ncbi:MAG: class II aldolase/adducin family protein [Bacillota bacterium]|nr:class II aldolase/adducin family protein [Bacillota bacterium]